MKKKNGFNFLILFLKLGSLSCEEEE